MANRASADAACAFDGMLPPTDSAAFLTHFDFSAIDEMDPSLGKPLILSVSSCAVLGPCGYLCNLLANSLAASVTVEASKRDCGLPPLLALTWE